MRPIDADALIADLLTVDPRYTEMVEWCCNVIRQTPTIEPSGDLISRKSLNDIKFIAIKGDKVEEAYRSGWNGAIECIIENAPFEEKLAEREWIPCSERLPEDSGDYLVCPSDGVIEDYSDCRDVMIIPYDEDCEAFGWWTERYDPISLGFVDCDFDEFEVLAWMPLPKPYREDGEI